jgi:hypothetical protein
VSCVLRPTSNRLTIPFQKFDARLRERLARLTQLMPLTGEVGCPFVSEMEKGLGFSPIVLS